MSACGCEGRRSGRVWFRYPSMTNWDNVISRRPPICWDCLPSGGQGNCAAYYVQVSHPRLNWTDFGGGNIANCEEYPSFSAYYLWGPISLFLEGPRTIGCNTGARTVYQTLMATCRGRYNFGRPSASPCGPTQTIELNLLFSVLRIESVTFTRIDGQPDPIAQTFRVTDQGGTIYTRTESTCPQVRLTCDDECPPGTEPLCNCCCDCRPLLADARSIRNLLTNL